MALIDSTKQNAEEEALIEKNKIKIMFFIIALPFSNKLELEQS